MPTSIARSRRTPFQAIAWRDLVVKKVRLAPWIAINRNSLQRIHFDEYQPVADAVQRELDIDAAVAREDIKLGDEELVKVIEKMTDRLEWHADAQWALKQWQVGAFDNQSEDYAAIFHKKVKGYGDDPNELRKIWSEKCGVPFQRIIVHYIGTEE